MELLKLGFLDSAPKPLLITLENVARVECKEGLYMIRLRTVDEDQAPEQPERKRLLNQHVSCILSAEGGMR